MNNASLAVYFRETAILAGQVLAVLAVLGIAGGGIVAALPRFCRVRWLIFAPLAGLMTITLASAPLSLCGVAAGHYAWPLLAALGLASLVALGRSSRRAGPCRRRRITRAYLRRAGPWLLLGFSSVVLLSSYLITAGGRFQVTSVWGTTDFGAYWAVGNYLQDHGASAAEYAAQATYHANDIADHLQKHARLGCMTTVAVLGHLITPGKLFAVLNAITVASLWLLVALGQALAERERLWRVTTWLMLGAYPFLYFLLYFNYQSQAFGVALVLAGLLVAEIDPLATFAAQQRAAVMAGLFFGAALLHYPSSFLAPGFYLITQLTYRGIGPGLRIAIACGLTMLVAAGYYLPQTFRELSWLEHSTVLPGWNWNRLIGVQEFLGLRSLQYFLPLPDATAAETIASWGIGAFVIVALGYAVCRGALSRSVLALLSSTALLAGSAYLRVRLQVPNATHGFAKVISQYAPFLLVFTVAGALAVWPRHRQRAQWVAVIILAFFAVIQVLELRRWLRTPWYEPELVQLVERHLGDAVMFEFDPGMLDKVVDPLVRDDRRWSRSGSGPRLRFSETSDPAAWPAGAVIDHEGPYVAVLLH